MNIHIYKDSEVVGKKPITNQMTPKVCRKWFDVKNTQIKHHSCLADLKDGIRRKDHFISIPAIQYDFDGGEYTPEKVSGLVIDFTHYILTSTSDSPTHRKFHLFVLLKDEITDADDYRSVVDIFAEKHGFWYLLDDKARDAVRFFVKHKGLAIPPVKGKPLDWKPLLSEKKKEVAKVKYVIKNEACQFITYKDYESWANGYCLRKNINLIVDGKRWVGSCILIGGSKLKSVPVDWVKQFLDANSNYSKGHFTMKNVHKNVDAMYSK
jgi:hypothetical protein